MIPEWSEALDRLELAHQARSAEKAADARWLIESEFDRLQARIAERERERDRLRGLVSRARGHVTAIYSHYSEVEIQSAHPTSQLGHYRQALAAMDARSRERTWTVGKAAEGALRKYPSLGRSVALEIETSARAEAIEEAAKICERMVIGGRAWTHDQGVAADALFAAAKNIRALLPAQAGEGLKQMGGPGGRQVPMAGDHVEVLSDGKWYAAVVDEVYAKAEAFGWTFSAAKDAPRGGGATSIKRTDWWRWPARAAPPAPAETPAMCDCASNCGNPWPGCGKCSGTGRARP